MAYALQSSSFEKQKRLFGYGIAGLDPRIAGFIFFLGMTWDAISDPIVATYAERITTKMGTYRPFILFGSAITAVAFILLFWVPAIDGLAKIVFLAVTCLIFRTSYTIVAIPYAAMGSRITLLVAFC